MPDRTGLDVIRDLATNTPEAERPAVVMMTAHGSIESAVEAMKLGARDYLQKPFEVDELLVLARRPSRINAPAPGCATCSASATPNSITTASSAAAAPSST
jgi:DNA-binding response OmpR family regulator